MGSYGKLLNCGQILSHCLPLLRPPQRSGHAQDEDRQVVLALGALGEAVEGGEHLVAHDARAVAAEVRQNSLEAVEAEMLVRPLLAGFDDAVAAQEDDVAGIQPGGVRVDVEELADRDLRAVRAKDLRVTPEDGERGADGADEEVRATDAAPPARAPRLPAPE